MWQISDLVANEWYDVTFVWLGNQSINTMLHLSDLVTITWNNDTLPMTVTSSTELLASTCWVKPSKCLSTLNMLNCFEDYKRYIHILRRILDLAWPKLTKLTLEQQYIFHVLCSLLMHLLLWERERERLSLSAFLRTEDIGVHIVHISRLIITYKLE